MELDLTLADPKEAYRLLTSVVVPRPIAWVTTLNREGQVNLAPFSFFNLLGADPPVVGLGIGARPDGTPKDTRANIVACGELVINLVDERLVDAMTATAIDFAPGVDEAAAVGLEIEAAQAVRVPRLAASRVHLECRLAHVVRVGNNEIVLAEVVHLHIAPEHVDAATRRVDTPSLALVGRGHGGGMYVRLRDWIEVPRLTMETWVRQQEVIS